MMEYHTPALLNESIDGLKIRPAGIYADLTFGAGGHSKEIIRKLKTGKLLAFDQDADAEQNVFHDSRLIFCKSNYRFFYNFVIYHGYGKIDGIIADLGISSFHIDMPHRGFSYRFDGELDMRMNRNSVLTAAQVVNSYEKEKLSALFQEYGELENARKLAEKIVNKRTSGEIKSTFQFIELISDCIPVHNENKYLSKVFQALRIEVNNELVNLKKMLLMTPEALKKNGRLVIITYNSLEDRLVKNFMKMGKFEGEVEKDFFGNVNVPFEPVNKKPVTPSEQELNENNRVRSAKLRVAQKL